MEDDNIFWHAMLRCDIQFMAAIFLTIFIIFFFPSSFRQEVNKHFDVTSILAPCKTGAHFFLI